MRAAASSNEEFVGPFASWANAKTTYGAVGNGVADDTAAIQRALNDLGTGGKPDVLYLPSGTYRITSTLSLKYKMNVSFIGQDPSNTVIRWNGPQGGTMLLVNGVTMSRWGRITWDGAGTAGAGVAHQWDQAGGFAPTNLEHADEVFQNMAKGIVGGRPGGSNDAEVAVLRSRFSNCSQAGISLENYNALNYWIWDSQFINTARGVTNVFGAGNFHVYRSLFQNSSVADISINVVGPFSARGNISIGSQQFFVAAQAYQNGAPVTLQDNRILDTANPVAIADGNLGLLSLIDNQIRTKAGASGPAVQMSDREGGAAVMSVGNKFTVTNPIAVPANGRPWSQDDQVVAYSQIDGTAPTMPGTPPNLNRHVFDIAAGASAGVIQQAINQAASLTGQRPVVHLPKANYSVAQTIVLPQGADVQIVGDGHGTNLLWRGAGGGAMFQLSGPSKATFREMFLNSTNADAIEIDNSDQVGARIYGSGIVEEHVQRNSVLTENLQNAFISFQAHEMSLEGGSGIEVIGAGGAGTSNLAVFGGTTAADVAGSQENYHVDNGGRLIVEDLWYEGSSRLTYLTGSGTFTLNTGHISPNPDTPVESVINVAGFNGAASFLGLEFDFHNQNRNIEAATQPSSSSVLFAGMACCLFSQNVGSGSSGYLSALSSSSSVSFFDGFATGSNGAFGLSNSGGSLSASFVRTALNQLRTVKPSVLSALPGNVTDVRLFRIDIAYPNVGIHVR